MVFNKRPLHSTTVVCATEKLSLNVKGKRADWGVVFCANYCGYINSQRPSSVAVAEKRQTNDRYTTGIKFEILRENP